MCYLKGETVRILKNVEIDERLVKSGSQYSVFSGKNLRFNDPSHTQSSDIINFLSRLDMEIITFLAS